MAVFSVSFAFTLLAVAEREARPVPEGARAAVAFAGGTKFVLGDVIEMTFVLSNAGPQSFQYETGGDYRGTGFPTRYKFTVTDETGAALPKETWMEMGGLSGRPELKPGETFRQLLRLQNYVRVDRPGTLKLSIAHDFGWKATEQAPWPVAEARITITLPTPQQAEAQVRRIASNQQPLKENELGAYWHKTEFRYLGHPVFLSALERQAAVGQVRALEGLQRIQSTNATLALVRLLSSKDASVSHGAALFLARRMPPRIVAGFPRRPFGFVAEEEAASSRKLWLPETEEPLRIAAGNLLRSTNVSYAKTGAFIVETIGKPEDGALVLEALRPTLEEWKVRDKPEDNILNAAGAGDALIAALAGLRERGYYAPKHGGKQVIMARLLELADPKIPRSDGWEQLLEAFFSQNPPMLREAAVRALPKPPRGKWERLLMEALNDQDRGVMREACIAAGDSGNPAFTLPLANIVRAEHQTWVVNAASEALTKLGAHWAATDAWMERLADERFWFEAMTFLVKKLEHPEGGGSGGLPLRERRVAMRQKWQTFFSEKNRQKLVQAGKPVPMTEVEARDLFSGSYSVSLEAGKSWPAQE